MVLKQGLGSLSVITLENTKELQAIQYLAEYITAYSWANR